MYNDVKPIIADYVNSYNMHIIDEFLNELENGDLQNNLAYDLAKYDGFTGDDIMDLINIKASNNYYNLLAKGFLLKYGFETKILKFPFPDKWKDTEKLFKLKNGDINPNIIPKYFAIIDSNSDQFRFNND
jgi:hypothetical protein